MQTIITTITLLFTTLILQAQNTVEVKMINFDNDKGTAMVGLYNSEENFLESGFMYKKSKIENEMATVIFTNVPDGDYAVSCFHDEDDNGKLNMFMGMMPTEDYGTSNNAPANFGPPKWIDAKFEIKDGDCLLYTSDAADE